MPIDLSTDPDKRMGWAFDKANDVIKWPWASLIVLRHLPSYRCTIKRIKYYYHHMDIHRTYSSFTNYEGRTTINKCKKYSMQYFSKMNKQET